MAFKSLHDPRTGRQVASYDPDTDRLEIRAPDQAHRRLRFDLADLRREAAAAAKVDSGPRQR